MKRGGLGDTKSAKEKKTKKKNKTTAPRTAFFVLFSLSLFSFPLLLPVLPGHPPAVGVGRRQLPELVVALEGGVRARARADGLDVAQPDALVDLLRAHDLQIRVRELLPPVGDVAVGLFFCFLFFVFRKKRGGRKKKEREKERREKKKNEREKKKNAQGTKREKELKTNSFFLLFHSLLFHPYPTTRGTAKSTVKNAGGKPMALYTSPE